MSRDDFQERGIVGLEAIWRRFCVFRDESGELREQMSFRKFNRMVPQLYEEGAILKGPFGRHNRMQYFTYPSLWLAWLLKRHSLEGPWPDPN